MLLDTIEHHLIQARACSNFDELVIIDQTELHENRTLHVLTSMNNQGVIRWVRCSKPHLTRSMNLGLTSTKSDLVLYTDDDVIPSPGWLSGHLEAHQIHRDAWAVVGQILQPGEEPEHISYEPKGGAIRRFLDFPFRSTDGRYIENAMAGNLSLKREMALKIGGFDENFPPPVASRFETEFAKRLVRSGGKIWFEPSASLRHLAASTGGTRSEGSHLTSMSPHHGIGDCYFAFRVGRGAEKWVYLLSKPFREVRTRFHLRNPWWIPVKFLGELRALQKAFCLSLAESRLIGYENRQAK